MEEIVNKVAQSALVEFNLEDYYDQSEREVIDLKDFLTKLSLGEGKGDAYILREKMFRDMVNNMDVSNYKNKLVAVNCSVDAIVPSWAYMLLTLALTPVAKMVVIGDLELLESLIFNNALNKIDASNYQNAKVVIKGCSKFKVPLNAYTQIAAMLKPYAKSIMYGEACSSVPLFKKPKF